MDHGAPHCPKCDKELEGVLGAWTMPTVTAGAVQLVLCPFCNHLLGVVRPSP